MKIISVVGARPNFMKIAAFAHAIERHNADLSTKNQEQGTKNAIQHILVHTGQHYDERMSKSFFDVLKIPHPDIDLGIGSGSHSEQVGNTMIAFEKVLQEHKPDWVVVVGDVNATCACSITAKKEHIKVAHIEAGLRSFDMEMPEEINRLVTDRLSDLLFTADELSSENLRKEGVPEERIKFVGNIMIDTLEAHREAAAKRDIATIARDNALVPLSESQRSAFSVPNFSFSLMTMHRPSNVDTKAILEPIIDFLIEEVCKEHPLLWAIHPRAEKQLKTFGLWERVVATENLILLHPLSYHEMLRLNMGADLMLTDSGGLQEECCVLGTPCMTLRWNTERPITLREHGGASVLVGNAVDNLHREYATIQLLDRTAQRPPLWDGQTADRIVEIMAMAGASCAPAK
jgi:UDP-N-acetylglucosamine 2-epimerase (non-hydrolysing)